MTVPIEVRANDEAREYLESIAQTMSDLFELSRDDANQRINDYWETKDFTEELSVDLLLHELPDHWAKRIYYGPDAKWWLNGEE